MTDVEVTQALLVDTKATPFGDFLRLFLPDPDGSVTFVREPAGDRKLRLITRVEWRGNDQAAITMTVERP